MNHEYEPVFRESKAEKIIHNVVAEYYQPSKVGYDMRLLTMYSDSQAAVEATKIAIFLGDYLPGFYMRACGYGSLVGLRVADELLNTTDYAHIRTKLDQAHRQANTYAERYPARQREQASADFLIGFSAQGQQEKQEYLPLIDQVTTVAPFQTARAKRSAEDGFGLIMYAVSEIQKDNQVDQTITHSRMRPTDWDKAFQDEFRQD